MRIVGADAQANIAQRFAAEAANDHRAVGDALGKQRTPDALRGDFSHIAHYRRVLAQPEEKGPVFAGKGR